MKNEKTSLGISVGLMGAALYFTILVGGYIPFLLLAGYVFFKENNDWLRRVAVKAFATYTILMVLAEAADLIPDAVRLANSFAGIFRGSIDIPYISSLFSCLTSFIYFIRTIVLLLLGFQAVKMFDFAIPVIDKMVDGGVAAAEKAVTSVKKEEPKAEAEKNEEN